MHPGDQRDPDDQRLSERRREQRACHSMWPEARDDGTDESDGKHPDIHQVGELVLIPDDANGSVYPDEDECCRKRNDDGGSVREIARLPRCQLIRETSAEQEGAGESEIGQVPNHFIGELHCQQEQQQYERCRERNADNVFVFHHDNCYPLSNNCCGRFDERPKCENEQSLSGFFAFSAEVVEGLRHSLTEALAKRLRVEAKQFCVYLPVSRGSVLICHWLLPLAKAVFVWQPPRPRGIAPVPPRVLFVQSQ